MLEAGCRSVVAVFFLVLACISGPSAEIAAQDTPTVAVGERVRVSTESGATHVGLLSAMTSGALEVQGEGGSQRFLVASVTRLGVSGGRKSHALLGAGIGFAAGALGPSYTAPGPSMNSRMRGNAYFLMMILPHFRPSSSADWAA